jgi:glucose-6-phosphate isomerase
MLTYNFEGLSETLDLSMRESRMSVQHEARDVLSKLCEELTADQYGPFQILKVDQDLGAMVELADVAMGFVQHVVVLGTGGSSLGPQALAHFQGLTGEYAEFRSGGVRFYFPDNLDGHDMRLLLDGLDLSTTLFLIVSKSGGTLETLIQASLVRRSLEFAHLNLAKHMVVITEPKESPLASFADHYRIPFLPHPLNIGGRYAMFSVVGMFPSLLMGLDPRRLRGAGLDMLENFLADPINHPATQSAIALETIRRQGYAAHIAYMYGTSLAVLGQWYRQLWAESVGKDGSGLLLDVVLGPVAQHSQLQLHMDGPHDKMFSIFDLCASSQQIVVEEETLSSVTRMVVGRDLSEVTSAQAQATGDVLSKRGRPVRMISMMDKDPEDLCRVMVGMMLETVVAAGLASVNPFDQPAVEEGKIRLKELFAQLATGPNSV